MWIYADEVTPGDHKAKLGDLVMIDKLEFGNIERQVGIVVETDDFDETIVNVMILPTDSNIFDG